MQSTASLDVPSLLPPTGFTASALPGGSVSLTWTNPPGIDDPADATIQIDRSDDGTHWTRVIALNSSSTSWTDNFAPEGEHAQYRIRNVQAPGPIFVRFALDGYSSYATATTRVQPVTPLLSDWGSPAPGEADLFWTDNSQGEDGYRVEWSTSSNMSNATPVDLPAGSTSYKRSGFAPGSTYYFRVVATYHDDDDNIKTSQVPTSGTGIVIAGGSDFTITPIGDPAQIGPDGRPQKGWFAVRRNNLSTDATVTLSYSGTAANGTDYTLSAGPTLDFVPNQAAQIIALTPLIHMPSTFDPTATAQLTGFSGVSGSLTITTPVDLQVTAHRTGGYAGEAISDSVKESGDPAEYVILTNNNYEEPDNDGQPDYMADSVAISAGDYQRDSNDQIIDPDLAKITIHQLPAGLPGGTVQIQLLDGESDTDSGSSNVKLFKDDGTLLYSQPVTGGSPLTLNLASPSGYLAGLLSGDVNVWLEGVNSVPNFAFRVVYSDTTGHQTAEDVVHMDIADWSFVDGYKNSVIYVPRVATETLQYVADNAADMPSTTVHDPGNFVTLNLGGLPTFPGGGFTVQSDTSSSSTVQDNQLISTGGATVSENKIGLYSADSNDSLLSADEVQTLEQTFGLDVVHNPEATITLHGTWDSQRRDLLLVPQITTSISNQVVRVGDTITGTVTVGDADPRFNYHIDVAGVPNGFEGTSARFTATARAANRVFLTTAVTIRDGTGQLIGIFADTSGSLIVVLRQNTSDATLKWNRLAFAALQVNGDVVPGYPATPFSASVDQFFDLNNRISRAYAAMYNADHDAFRWCGLAANTSNRAGQGIAASGILDDVFRGLGLAPNAVLPYEMYQSFTALNLTIFSDLYPQFEAYLGGGQNAIQSMSTDHDILQGQVAAWGLIDAGKQAGNQADGDFWSGALGLADVEQHITAQAIYDQYMPLFLFLTNDSWFATQLKSSVPGSGPNNSFGAVVPVGTHGGQANIGDKDDRWAWITGQNGIWSSYQAWQPSHLSINLADVTNTGLIIPTPLPTLGNIIALANWRPPA